VKHGNGDKPDNAKAALEDYYGDLLGSLAGSPLEEKQSSIATDAKETQAEEKAETSPESPTRKAATAKDKSRDSNDGQEFTSASGGSHREPVGHDDVPKVLNSETSRRELPSLSKDRITARTVESVFPGRSDYSASRSASTLSVEPEQTNGGYKGPERRRSMLAQKPILPVTQTTEDQWPESPIIPAAFPKLAPQQIPSVSETETLETAVEAADVASEKTQISEALAPNEPDEGRLPQDAKIQTPVAEPSETQALDQQIVQANLQVAVPQPWLDNGRPVWAQNRFECLLFTVAGLKLAVPLVSLGAIHRLDEDLTPLVGRADWFMGLFRHGDRNIQVVDTALWVMPDRYRQEFRDEYQFVIRLGDTNWGMACNSVEQAIQLEPSQVKWRSERSKRAWLSGTVIDHMCALLDADTLSYLLQQDADKKRRH